MVVSEWGVTYSFLFNVQVLLRTDFLLLSVMLVLLSKLCSIHNIIRKSEFIQTVTILKSRDFRETITVFPCSPLRRVFSHLRFTGLSCPVWGYTTWRLVLVYSFLYSWLSVEKLKLVLLISFFYVIQKSSAPPSQSIKSCELEGAVLEMNLLTQIISESLNTPVQNSRKFPT